MRHASAGLLMCLAALTGGCIMDAIAGSGNVVTESRPVSGFRAVSVGGSGQLFIEKGAAESLTVTADDNLLPYIKTEVRGDQLQLGFRDSMSGPNVQPTRGIVFRLTVKALDELHVSGSGSADVRGIDGPRVRLRVSGSGEIAAQGAVNDLEVGISGSGRYLGDRLASNRALVDISGSGKALVNASDRLDVDVSGSGDVVYIGAPQVSRHISGSGSVRRRD